MSETKFIRTCSIWRALEVIGDTSTLLILEASFLGARRFDELRVRTGLLKALLSERLKRLVAAGVLEKKPYTDAPPRYEYHLTQKGRDLYWAALMMLRWERRWAARDGKIDVVLTHKTCGVVFEPTPACACCGQEVCARDVSWSEGPGVGWMAAAYSRRRQQRDATANRPARSALLDEIAQIVGDRWASLVLRSIFTGLRRFDEIRGDTGMATNILSERLSWLAEMGVINSLLYSVNPARYEYRLAERGIDYYPVLLMILNWGDKYYVAPEGLPLLLKHEPCGAALEAVVACSHCGEPIRAEDVDYEVVEAEAPGVAEALSEAS